MKLNCIVVEDEPLALERAKGYIAKVPFLNLLTVFDNGIDALVFLKSNPVDLIFLDISLGEMSGIQLLEAANITGEVIVTTAYDQYALKGFELNVTDYLLKPYTFERFFQAVERAQNNLSSKNAARERKFIFIKTEYRLENIELSDILFIEGMRDYRRIHTTTKRIMTLQTFKELEDEIPSHAVCRVHKSYMVALGKIESIERDRIKIKDTVIPISETYKRAFLELLRESR
jgi:two-component system, LytTR family, response regulator